VAQVSRPVEGVRAFAPPIARLKFPGIVPIRNIPEGASIAVGTAQRVTIPHVPAFYMLRFQVVDSSPFEDTSDVDLEESVIAGGSIASFGSFGNNIGNLRERAQAKNSSSKPISGR